MPAENPEAADKPRPGENPEAALDPKRAAFRALADRVAAGPGSAPAELRGRAFAGIELPAPLHALIEKVTTNPAVLADADFAVAEAAGYPADQLVELVICAAVGQSDRLYQAGLAALAEASGSTEPGHAS